MTQSKKQVLSFDGYCKKESVSGYYYSVSKSAYEAGQQSRQEEVNKLQTEIYDLELKLKSNDHSAREVINAMSMHCNYYLTEIDELQRKYGSVMKTNEMLVAYKNELLDEIENNIKGQRND